THVTVAAAFGTDTLSLHDALPISNDGNVTLHNVNVTDAQVSDLSCTPAVPVTSLAPTGTINCTASHTITQADLDAGHYFNEACRSDGHTSALQSRTHVVCPLLPDT